MPVYTSELARWIAGGLATLAAVPAILRESSAVSAAVTVAASYAASYGGCKGVGGSFGAVCWQSL